VQVRTWRKTEACVTRAELLERAAGVAGEAFFGFVGVVSSRGSRRGFGSYAAPHGQFACLLDLGAGPPARQSHDPGFQQVQPVEEACDLGVVPRGRLFALAGSLVVTPHRLRDLLGADVAGGVRDHQMTARRQGVTIP
jgi:hypothetical protein